MWCYLPVTEINYNRQINKLAENWAPILNSLSEKESALWNITYINIIESSLFVNFIPAWYIFNYFLAYDKKPHQVPHPLFRAKNY